MIGALRQATFSNERCLVILNTSNRRQDILHPYLLFVKGSGAKDLHGLCSLALVHDGLFRESYQVNIIYFVSFMHDAYVVVIVRTEDKGSVVTVSSSGVNSSPDVCQDVPGRI